jgi:hypothetical protein
MADKKISELVVATSVSSTDVLTIVQDNQTKQVSIETLFSNASSIKTNGSFSIDNSSPVLSTGGVIPLTSFLSIISNSTDSQANFSIESANNGMFKLISVGDVVGPISINVNGNNFTYINFVSSGSCLLHFNSNEWHIVANNGGVIV